jgi:two-component system, OmpR family, KDP operon response regulator KdpE
MTDAMHLVLVIEDEPGMRAVLRATLEASGYRVTEAESLARGEFEARNRKPDVILLDLGLPDGDGGQLIRKIRQWSPVPIIVLSARTMEEQKVLALDGGADDYVTKPFATSELLARVRAVARRGAHSDASLPVIHIGEFSIDLGRRRTARSDATELHLTPIEYRLLECLARRAGSIVTREQLLREVWGPDRVDDTRGLRVFLKRLRDKLEPDPHRPRFLLTETGIGYRLQLEPSAA